MPYSFLTKLLRGIGIIVRVRVVIALQKAKSGDVRGMNP